MNFKKYLIWITLLISGSLGFWYFTKNSGSKDNNISQISVKNAVFLKDSDKFSKALKPITFDFPKDHTAHNDFALEWWYFTGNVSDQNKNDYGYQFTIFRKAMSADTIEKKSSFSSNQLYFAHLAVTDIEGNQHYHFEKFARGIKGFAGTDADPLKIYIEDWEIVGLPLENKNNEFNFAEQTFKLKAEKGSIGINLNLVPKKKIVLHGDSGLSAKNSTAESSSYYYSITRLLTEGEIKINGKSIPVKGNSWFDREWSSTMLGKNQVGWDWFSLQLNDNSELMFFRLRDNEGNTDFSKGTIVFPDGKYATLSGKDIFLKTLENVKLESGNVYPSKWELSLPKYNLNLQIKTRIKDQEMKTTVNYYEGSVRTIGTKDSKKIDGKGFVELTGYSK